MLHGPCGVDNPQAKCMVNRKCSKHFSKKYRERTTLFYSREYVMNIEWDYNYYQPWSDNEQLVDEMLAMLDEDIIMQ